MISKDEFKVLKVEDVKLNVVDYNYSLLSHTQYEVQISIVPGNINYLKCTRYRHLQAFDHVLRERFKNLEFPKFPDNGKLLKFNKEKERAAYLQTLLDLIMSYAVRYPNLKVKLFSFLFNLLLRGDL